jgi:hypothetical protein
MSYKLSYDQIKDFFNKYGYELLDKDLKNACDKFCLMDKSGYKYHLSKRQLGDSFNRSLKEGLKYSPDPFNLANPYTVENICLWIEINKKPFKFDSGYYSGNQNRTLFFKCNICNNVWDAQWDVVQQGFGCPYCSRKRTVYETSLSFERPDLVTEWDYEKNGTLSPDTISPRSGKRIWWKCAGCGYSWNVTVHDRNYGPKLKCGGCPNCYKKSNGELMIENILEKYFVEYIIQKRFPDCRNIQPLPFDFYLPNFPVCIEYNGIQHYEPGNYFESFKSDLISMEIFEEQKFRDQIKKDYCFNKGITFIEIPYWNFDNIEQILVEKLSLTKK